MKLLLVVALPLVFGCCSTKPVPARVEIAPLTAEQQTRYDSSKARAERLRDCWEHARFNVADKFYVTNSRVPDLALDRTWGPVHYENGTYSYRNCRGDSIRVSGMVTVIERVRDDSTGRR